MYAHDQGALATNPPANTTIDRIGQLQDFDLTSITH
jgi:hypothetical protein